MTRLLTVPALACACGGLMTASAVAHARATPASGSQTVHVVVGRPLEFGFTVTPGRVHTGVVMFRISNTGLIPHDFQIRGRKTAPIPPHRSVVLRVEFPRPGRYTYVSTLPGQIAAGLIGRLVVTADSRR